MRLVRDGVLGLFAVGIVALLIGPHVAKKFLLVGCLVYAAMVGYGLFLNRARPAKQPRPTPEPPAVV
jgi:hypothetical protein